MNLDAIRNSDPDLAGRLESGSVLLVFLRHLG